MSIMRSTAAITLSILALLFGVPAAAYEIYQWTDDQGVVHFSQWEPGPNTPDVSKLTLASTNPPDYDPDDDTYSIRNQAERTNSVWSRLEEKRNARREEREKAAERAAQYQPQYYQPRYYFYPAYPYYWRKPRHPVQKPHPPRFPVPHGPAHGGGNRQPANGAAARRNRGPNRVVTPLPPPRQHRPPTAVPFASPRHLMRH